MAQHTTSLERAVSLNPSFASLKGNPMETMEDSEAESILQQCGRQVGVFSGLIYTVNMYEVKPKR